MAIKLCFNVPIVATRRMGESPMLSQTATPEALPSFHPDRITLTIALPRDASVNLVNAAMQAFQSEFGIPLVRDGLHFSVPTDSQRVGAA